MTCQPQALHNIKHIKHIQWQWRYKKEKCYITKKRRTQKGFLLLCPFNACCIEFKM